ncbi:MAG TPA: hypothetical protein VK734_10205 [Bradyrhizobium sp.]|jgi:hypothetical protein|nr:hypothetical protein [Bradyrhizobium sp.]
MSESQSPEVPPPLSPRLPPEQRSGCLTAILIVIGIILLLPGLCSLIFVFGGLVKSAEDVQFVIALGLASCAGVGLIWWAIRGRRS